jgi:hypothetical protein
MSQTKAQLIDSLVQPITGAAGSESAPTFSFTADTNTGIYSPGENQLAISTDGAGRLFIDSTGDVSVHANRATNRPRIILSAPDDATNFRHLFGANLQVDADGTYTTPASVISGGGWLYESINNLNEHGSMIYLSSSDTNNTSSTPLERLRIDGSGRLLVGTGTARDVAALTPSLQLEGTTGGEASLSITRNQNSVNPPFLVLAKSRGTENGDSNIVESGDSLGEIRFAGADDVDLSRIAASVSAVVDGTPGEDQMPGRIRFSTNPGTTGAAPQVRMTIKSDGNVGIGTPSPNAPLQVQGAAGEIRIQRPTEAQSDWSMKLTSSSGEYEIYDNNNTAARLTINASGAVGIGVTPEAVDDGMATLQFGGTGALHCNTATAGSVAHITRNVYRRDNGTWAAIITDEATRYIQSDNFHRFDVASSTTADAEISFTSELQIDADGIKFGGDTAAANALDDYEEGTWTPSYEPHTGAFTSITYDPLTEGTYTRIGNLVTCSFAIRTDAITIGTASGNLYISGLPFASSTTGASEAGSGFFAYSANFTGDVPSACLTQSTSTRVRLYYKTTANGNSAGSDVADLSTSTNANYTIGTISYFA